MKLFQSGLLHIVALLSYCGGPLLVADLMKPHTGMPLAFVVTFLPVLLMLFGIFALHQSGWTSRARRAGAGFPEPGELAVAVQPSSTVADLLGWGDDARHEILMVRLGLVGAVVLLFLHAYGAWSLASAPGPDSGLHRIGLIVGLPVAGGYVYVARRWLRGG